MMLVKNTLVLAFQQRENVVCIKVIVKIMDPYCLGVYLQKEDGPIPYYWPLLSGLETGEDRCKDLGVGMCVKRRVEVGIPSDILKQTKNTGLWWNMLVRFLDEGELNDSHKIGTAWGLKVSGKMAKFFFKARQNKKTSNLYYIKKYVSNVMEESVENVSDFIVLSDVVSMAGVIFKDSIENRKLFTDEDLMQLPFPGLLKPEIFYPNLM